jgi:N-acetyl-anhydromuramyl-L-alanine amidase AmpD
MRFNKVDERWQRRKNTPENGKLEPDVSYVTEQWEIPGEDPLEIRVCRRDNHPMNSFCSARESEKTSIVLHTTAGYGGFSTLMGGDGDGRQASAHFMLGRDGIAYLLVKTEWVAWHATWWNENSVGIEVDTICQLFKGKNDTLHSEYGPNDIYCTTADTGAYFEKPWPGHGNARYWATWTEEQYVGCARLLKAISHKHNIPRVVLAEPARYNPFPPADRAQERRDFRKKFRGLCTHLNIDPARRIDIGPFIDWDKLLRYGEYQDADCLSAPDYAPPSGGMAIYTPAAAPSADSGGGGSAGAAGGSAGGASAKSGGGAGGAKGAGGSGAASSGTGAKAGGAASSGAGAKAGGAAKSTSAKSGTGKQGGSTQPDVVALPPPVQVDARTLKVSIGKKGGRIALTVRRPGEPIPTTPPPGELPTPQADGKRDEFLRAAMNFLGCPYKAGSDKPAEGIDGPGLISICLKRVGLLKEEDPDFDGAALFGMWPHAGGHLDEVPAEILPGDIAWFGQGDHDSDACQHPMIWLGGGRVLGPLAAGGKDDGAVQVIPIDEVKESFGGWTHIDDLGVTTAHTAHPGEAESAGVKLTGALLPLAPAARYDALQQLVSRQKGSWDGAKGKVNLVGVKNLHERCAISPRPDDWNDTLFAAFLDDDGNKCVLELKASLNPGNDTTRQAAWQLWEGSWKFKLADGDKTGAKALQPDGKVKGWEDKEGSGAPRVTEPVPDPNRGKDGPKPKEETPDKAPAASTGGAFVFDAAGKKPSMKFGLRMMKALMEWELKQVAEGKYEGCAYSAYPGSPNYDAPGGGYSAWPDLRKQVKLEPPRKGKHGGQEFDLWHAFGIDWAGVNETNCCNSQMAAIFAANPDGILRVKRDSGIEEIDVVGDTPLDEVSHYKTGKKKKLSKGYLFENVWVVGEGSAWAKDGKRLQGGSSKTSPAWAMEYLGVGQSVVNWGDRKSLPKVRIGDDGMWASHNWLVGDVRYLVTFANQKKARCDQSCFARSATPVLEGWNLYGGRAATKEDCDWIEANEEEFEKRLAAFLDAKQLDLFGVTLEVKSIVPAGVSVFSGNCIHWTYGDGYERGTAGGRIYRRPAKDKTAAWEYDDAWTKKSAAALGVSRLWHDFPADNSFGFARWFDNAGGAEPGGATAPAEKAPALDDAQAFVLLAQARFKGPQEPSPALLKAAIDQLEKAGRYQVDRDTRRVLPVNKPMKIANALDFILFVEALESMYPKGQAADIVSEIRQTQYNGPNWDLMLSSQGLRENGAAGKLVNIEEAGHPISRLYDLAHLKNAAKSLETRQGKVAMLHVCAGIDATWSPIAAAFPRSYLTERGANAKELAALEDRFALLDEAAEGEVADFATWAGDLGQAYAELIHARFDKGADTRLADYVAKFASPPELLGDLLGYIADAVSAEVVETDLAPDRAKKTSRVLRNLFLVDKAQVGMKTLPGAFVQRRAGSDDAAFLEARVLRFARLWYAKLRSASLIGAAVKAIGEGSASARDIVAAFASDFDGHHAAYEKNAAAGEKLSDAVNDFRGLFDKALA